MTTHYAIGRFVVRVCLVAGYALGAVLGASMGLATKTNTQIIIGALLGAAVLGLLSHGLYHAVLALFDIADHAREANLLAQAQISAKRPPATPRPAPDPTPGADLHPGETDLQWAQRIEREEAAAFRARAAKI